MCSPRLGGGCCRRPRAEPFGRLGERGDRAGHHVLAVEQREPVRERLRAEDLSQLAGEASLVLRVVPLDEILASDQLAEALARTSVPRA